MNRLQALFGVFAWNALDNISLSQGAYNGFAAIKADGSDTIFQDNLRGGDATGTNVAGDSVASRRSPEPTLATPSTPSWLTPYTKHSCVGIRHLEKASPPSLVAWY